MEEAAWVFVGIVAGVVMQIGANLWMVRLSRSNAKEVLLCELEMNLSEVEDLKRRTEKLKLLVSSDQLDGSTFIDMHAFDYSAVQPLVQSGHFHKLLGAEGVKDFFAAMRFFGVQNAIYMTQILLQEHNERKSVQFIDWFEKEVSKHEINLKRTIARIEGNPLPSPLAT